MKDIYLLTDYQNRFGSKHYDSPYRSGMDKNLLQKYFAGHGFKTHFISFSNVNFREMNFKGKYVLYTSSEDVGYHYKDYIEDIILGLHLQGAILLPGYKYLRANNNKVFMEILRDSANLSIIKNIKSYSFGTYEEFEMKSKLFKDKVVLKTSVGACSNGVHLSRDENHLSKLAKKISRTRYLFNELWDTGRSFKHKGYKKESIYRKKFIVQDFIPGLKNDWKIYVFGDKYFIFYRPILDKNDFRASGGGYDNYLYGESAPRPEGIFDFAKQIFDHLDIPHASLDIAYKESNFYLLEFQAVYFGTAGIRYSNEYFIEQNSKWVSQKNELDIEKVYVDSIISHIEKMNGLKSNIHNKFL